MTEVEFKRTVRVLDADESSTIRSDYIRTFVDTESEFYKRNIATKRLYRDGWFYQGYLWDCIRPIEAQKFTEFSRFLSDLKRPVNVMWDLHSEEKIPVLNYWKFPRDRVIMLDSDLIPGNLEHLPEDIYVFDSPLCWTYIATHDTGADDSRIFARAGRRPAVGR